MYSELLKLKTIEPDPVDPVTPVKDLFIMRRDSRIYKIAVNFP